jgi:uncharacterized hydrophobic protein (TIGR00271 family)
VNPTNGTAGDPSVATAAGDANATDGQAPRTDGATWRDWLNPAITRGTILVIVGIIILSTPDASAGVLRFVIGGALLINGGITLWHHVKGQESTHSSAVGRAEAGLLVVLGLFLLVYPVATLDLLALVIGALLAVRGVLAIIAGFQRERAQPLVDFARGAGMLALAAFAIATPDSLIRTLVLLSGAAAIAVGGLLIASGARAASHGLAGDVDAASLARIIAEWVHTWDIGRQRREEIGDGLYFEEPDRAPKLIAWWVMLLLSVVIATFAVLQDSTAVVIGAMLVAPLMVPILGAAAAIVNGEQHRVGGDLLLVLLGVLASIGLAFIIAKWTPAIVPLTSNSQVTSRVNPNIIDMGIALAAGAAGAFATVNKRVASSIAGVAIAVALVPPLAVVGVTLEAGRYDDAGGAFLLFSTNLVAILLAAVAVFVLSGYTSAVRLHENRKQMLNTLTIVGGAAIVILIPLVLTAQQVITDQLRQSQAQQVASTWLEESDGLSLESVSVVDRVITVEVTGSDRLPSVAELGEAMQEEFGAATTTTVEFTPASVTTYSPDGTVTRDEVGR